MAINTDTIISSYDERLTLLQWLKKLEGAIADFDLEKYYTKDEVLALLANKVSNADFNALKATTRDGYRNLSDALDGLANTKADVSALNNVIGNVDELDGKVGNLEVEISEKADKIELDEVKINVSGLQDGLKAKQSKLYQHSITYRDDDGTGLRARFTYILSRRAPVSTLADISTGIASFSGVVGGYRDSASILIRWYYISSDGLYFTFSNDATALVNPAVAVTDSVTEL